MAEIPQSDHPPGNQSAVSPAIPPVATEGGAPHEGDPVKRRQILDGARRVFRARGFDGASMGEIAKAAGVSKGTLYVYFDHKQALFHALTLEEKRTQVESLFSLDIADPDVRGVMRRLGLNFFAHVVRPENISNIRMVIGAAEKFPEIGQVFYQAGPATGVARLQAYLDAQTAAGRLHIADTRQAAQHFFDLCQSGAIRRLLFAVGDTPDEAECIASVDAALMVFFAAYGPR